MYPYVTKEDALQAFRDLVGKLRIDRWGFIHTANPVLQRVLELHFGSFSAAQNALDIDAATREGWRVYWEEARKQGRTMRKLEEELERDWPKPGIVALPEALARVEQAPEFPSCRSEADIEILALCVLGDARIMEHETGLVVDVGDLSRFIQPLMRRLAARGCVPLEGMVAEPSDQSMLALIDLCDELRFGREEIQKLGRELGAHISWRTGMRPMAEELLGHARQTRTLARLINLLGKESRKVLDQSASWRARKDQDLTEVREELDRAKTRIEESAWADARQHVLGLLDTLQFTKEKISSSLVSIGLPKGKPSLSRQELCCYLFDAAESHGSLNAVLTVLEDELRRKSEQARTEQEEGARCEAEDREKYRALLGILCKEAGIEKPELGFDKNASDIEHGRLIQLLVEVGNLLGHFADKEFAHERFIYDVVWRKIPAAVPSHVFEVQVAGNLTEALARLKSAADLWNSKLCLVANSKDTEKARWMRGGSFHDIAQSVRFLAPAEVTEFVETKRRRADFERRFS